MLTPNHNLVVVAAAVVGEATMIQRTASVV
jgi:hypothetical protein